MNRIEIEVKGSTKMVVETDEQGKFLGVKDEKGGKIAPRTIKGLTLDGKPVVSISDGTIIKTKHNPTCVWYFINGKYYLICR